MDEFRNILKMKVFLVVKCWILYSPTIKDTKYQGKRLKVLRVRDDKDFKREEKEILNS